MDMLAEDFLKHLPESDYSKGYKQGVNSQQQEVQDLKRKLESKDRVIEELRDLMVSAACENDKLQDRINKALDELDSYFGDNYPVLMTIKILWGV